MIDSASSIVGEEAVSAVRRPIESAWGLPAAAYTSEEFFRLEQRKYLRKMWMAAAFEAELAEPGDAKPVTVAGLPIILVRGDDGEIRAFHNVCRHRGMMVLGEPCQRLKQFTCPYHAWNYGLDGNLIRAPFFDGTPRGQRERRHGSAGAWPRAGALRHLAPLDIRRLRGSCPAHRGAPAPPPRLHERCGHQRHALRRHGGMGVSGQLENGRGQLGKTTTMSTSTAACLRRCQTTSTWRRASFGRSRCTRARC